MLDTDINDTFKKNKIYKIVMKEIERLAKGK